MPEALLQVCGVSKSFGGVQALADVSLTLAPGQVHALCGENGAGKSTLIRVIAGSCVPDAGSVLVRGRRLPSGRVRAAEDAGIAVIHQEPIAFSDLTAVENIFVGREPRRLRGLWLDRPAMRRAARRLLAELTCSAEQPGAGTGAVQGEPAELPRSEPAELGRPVGELPLAQRQMVAIARALVRDRRVLIMDEPTASLSERESGALFRVVRRLQARGVGVLYVSHRLEEIFALADCVSVLRDGRHVATCPIRDIDRGGLIRLMIGRELGSTPPAGSVAARPGLCTAAQRKQPAIAAEHAGLRVERLARRGAFDDVSLDVRPGEIVGLAGLVGAGRSELARAIFGIDRYDRGRVLADGKELRPGSVRAALATGVALAPEDRQVAGLVLPMSVRANLTLAVLRTVSRLGLLSRRRERRLATELQGDLLIRAAGLGAPAWSLSGGNQQKLLLGKWLATRPRVLILDEPTRGVDVGAKAEIHALIRRLAGEGMATLLISSELPEVLLLSDRVLVMRAGRIVGELLGAEATQEQVLALALPDEPAQTTDIQARDI